MHGCLISCSVPVSDGKLLVRCFLQHLYIVLLQPELCSSSTLGSTNGIPTCLAAKDQNELKDQFQHLSTQAGDLRVNMLLSNAESQSYVTFIQGLFESSIITVGVNYETLADIAFFSASTVEFLIGLRKGRARLDYCGMQKSGQESKQVSMLTLFEKLPYCSCYMQQAQKLH